MDLETLASTWLDETIYYSAPWQMKEHPAFAQLSKMEGALDFAIDRLKLGDYSYQWFLLGMAITGHNPAPVECRGRLSEMAKYWIEKYGH